MRMAVVVCVDEKTVILFRTIDFLIALHQPGLRSGDDEDGVSLQMGNCEIRDIRGWMVIVVTTNCQLVQAESGD